MTTWIQAGLVFIGLAVMLAAFSRALRLANAIGAARQRRAWIVLLVLMGVFLCGYAGAVWIILSNEHELLESVAVVIFALVAVFVFLTVRLSLAISQALLMDIQQRRRAEDEVRKLNQGLEERVDERTRELELFAYSVSHDLRTPLVAIAGYSTALLEDHGHALDDAARSHLDRILANTEHMGRLINGLLHLARLTSMEIRWEEVDLSAIARSIADDLQRRSPKRKVYFVIKPGLKVTGDPTLLHTAVENLMGNAWKFTSQHARAMIELDVEEVDGSTAYVIRDDGAGFEPAEADELFKTFKRLHDPGKYPGTGVGLVTVQRIVNRHGGRIWAKGAVGKGAAFYFTLPGPGASEEISPAGTDPGRSE